jgi:hypothetical protein
MPRHTLLVRGLAALLIALAGVAGLAARPPAASAHERVTVGPYTLVVGWVNEPPYAGQLNGLELRVITTDGEEPVAGLEETLQFAVEYGGQTAAFALRPVFGEEGAYTADLLPTQRGVYTFHFTGAIESEPVDVTVEVHEVESPSGVEFPAAGEGAGEAAGLRDEVAGLRTLALVALGAGILGVVAGAGGVLLARRR